MRKLLILAVAVVAILLIAGMLVRRSLMQGELREAVEARLSATLGQPVSIERLDVSIFPRVALAGTEVRIGTVDDAAPAVAVDRVRILPRTTSLFSGDVIIEEVQLDGFVASILHDESGWHLPAVAPAPTPGSDGGVVIERVRLANARIRVFDRESGEIRERASIDDIDTDVVIDGADLRLAPITGRIGDAPISAEARVDVKAVQLELVAEEISHEDLPVFLRLLGSERPDFLRLSKPAAVSATLRIDRSSSRLTGKGKLSAPGVELSPLHVERFDAPFTVDGPQLEFDPATFALYGGTHQGSIRVSLVASPPGWTADSRLRGVDASAFLSALNGGDQRIDGTAAIDGTLQGSVGDALATGAHGRARIELTNGTIRDFPLLEFINRSLRLAEQSGSDTRFERLSATLSIARGVATTNDLVLQASHIRVEAAGRIGVDRSLALHGTAAVSPERSSAAIASIHELKGLRNKRGEVEIPLTIAGTLDDPSFGLDVEAAIKKGIADELRRQIRRIIR